MTATAYAPEYTAHPSQPLDPEEARLRQRRYELAVENREVMRAFCNMPGISPSLYADYRREFLRMCDRVYATYYALHGKFHPALF